MKRWMLFVDDATGQHYFWNAKEALCVQPGSLDYGEPLEGDPAQLVHTLTEAATTPKVRMFKLDRQRYLIVAKGILKEY